MATEKDAGGNPAAGVLPAMGNLTDEQRKALAERKAAEEAALKKYKEMLAAPVAADIDVAKELATAKFDRATLRANIRRMEVQRADLDAQIRRMELQEAELDANVALFERQVLNGRK